MLDEQGVENYIDCDDALPKLGNHQHRIQYLATVRNRVLEPFYNMSRERQDEIAHIIFSNDIYFCAEDLLELILNAKYYESDVTCAHDYIPVGPLGSRVMGFYDIWVTRDIDGNVCDNSPPNDPPCFNPKSFHRYSNNWAYQSHSCWGGVVVLNPDIFKGDIRFRSTKYEEDKQMESVVDIPYYLSCDQSEINTLFKDLRKNGLSRAIAVPSVKVAYTEDLYIKLMKEWTKNLRPSLYKKFDLRQMIKFQYKDLPKFLYCHPIENGSLDGKDLSFAQEGIEPVPSAERSVKKLNKYIRN